MKAIMVSLVILASVVIIISFFMPWAKVSTSVGKVSERFAETAKSKFAGMPLAEKFTKGLKKATVMIEGLGVAEGKVVVSGYDIPAMVNKKSSKVAISIAQVILKDTKDLDKKSMLVFLIPLVCVVCSICAIVGLRSMAAVIVMTILSGAISLVGLYNLMTANLSNMVVQISIERGLWQTMYSYLCIFIIGIVWLIIDMKKGKG